MAESPDLDIALVGPAYPYRGGIAHFLEKMQRGLTDRGHRTQIFTFTRQYPELLFPGKTQFASLATAPDPLPVRTIDALNPLSWIASARRIGRSSPRVVVFKYWMPFFAPAFGTVARRVRTSGSRVVVVVDNVVPHERRPGDVLLTRYFLSAVDGFVVMSRKVGDDLRTLGYRAPVRLVEHPTYDNFGAAIPRHVARERLGLPADTPVLLFFGFVRRYKGLQTLLSAMPAVTQALPSARLLVAGEFYDDEQAYRRQIADLDLDDRVTLFSDYIPDEDVTTFFSAADAVVQPYTAATQSGVAQIAFNFDRPVITTDVGGLAETVKHGRTGLVVEPDNPSALASAVIAFFREGMGTKLSAAVAREKERFGWRPLFEAIEELGGVSEEIDKVD